MKTKTGIAVTTLTLVSVLCLFLVHKNTLVNPSDFRDAVSDTAMDTLKSSADNAEPAVPSASVPDMAENSDQATASRQPGTTVLYHYDPASLQPYELSHIDVLNMDLAEQHFGKDRKRDIADILLLGAGAYEIGYALNDKNSFANVYGDPSRTRHFFACAGLSTLVYMLTSESVPVDNHRRYLVSVGFATFVGLAKEVVGEIVYKDRPSAKFDWGDMAANFIGANVGYVITNTIHKKHVKKERNAAALGMVKITGSRLERLNAPNGAEKLYTYYTRLYAYSAYKRRMEIRDRAAKAENPEDFKKAVEEGMNSIRPENLYRAKFEFILRSEMRNWDTGLVMLPGSLLEDAFRDDCRVYYETLKTKSSDYWRTLLAGGLYTSLREIPIKDPKKVQEYMLQAGFTGEEIGSVVEKATLPVKSQG